MMNATDDDPQIASIENYRIISNVAWSLAAILGVPANVFVLFSICYFKDMRTISHVYIFNLALADMMFLLGTPFLVITSITREWVFGSFSCTIYICGGGIAQFASAAFIGVLSADRYLAICRPLGAAKFRSLLMALLISLMAWLMVIVEVIPLMLFVKLIKFGDEQGAKCALFVGDSNLFKSPAENSSKEESEAFLAELEDRIAFSKRFFLTYAFTLSYLVPVIAVWFFYAKIINAIWNKRKQLVEKRRSIKRRKQKVTMLGLAIIISYTICHLPYWFVQWSIVLDSSWFTDHSLRTGLSYGAHALQYINSAANPFLYVFLSKSFKKNFRLLWASQRNPFCDAPSRASASDVYNSKLIPNNLVTNMNSQL